MNTKAAQRSRGSVNSILYWVVGGLLVLTMFSVWMLSGLFAKYVTSNAEKEAAWVARFGVVEFAVKEHKADEIKTAAGGPSGMYQLLTGDENEVTKNEYQKVLPGVDIPKDPFVKLKLEKPEVDIQLYIRVIESKPFPENVKYEIDKTLWEPVDEDYKIYRYKGYFDALHSFEGRIYILKDNKIEVREHYVGDGEFSLSFEAWVKQVD